VAETLPRGIDLFDVRRVHLVEVEAPPLAPEDESARDRVWDMAVRANPARFDGPVVACAGLGWVGPHALQGASDLPALRPATGSCRHRAAVAIRERRPADR
jgi:hypothetical protein